MTGRAIDWRSIRDDVRARLSISDLMHDAGWHVSRNRKRASCGLCGGKDDVALKGELWLCHKCKTGGDIFSFIEKAHNLSSADALRHLAAMAGVALPTKETRTTRQEQTELRRRQLKRQRVAAISARLEERERELRNACRRLIHACDDILEMPGSWTPAEWELARKAYELREEFLAPEYALLSFAQVHQRTEYVLASDVQRARMLARVRSAGGVMADHNHFIPIL
jgi:hypothetical protein